MSYKLLLAFVACLPIALSGCGGGGGGGGASSSPTTESPAPSNSENQGGGSEPTEEADLLEAFENYQRRVGALNITHAEMTDIILTSRFARDSGLGARAEHVCSDSVTGGGPVGTVVTMIPAVCTITLLDGSTSRVHVNTYVLELQGASDQSNGFSSLVPGGRINLIELAVKSFPPDEIEGTSAYDNVIGGVGRYSGFSAVRTYSNGRFISAYSQAFGERAAMRPSAALGAGTARATWRGAMVGTSISDSGPALAGEVILTYEVADNMVDVDISNVRSYDDVSYTGPSSFSWSDLQVQSDGEFHQAGSQNNHISGSFYGSKTDEIGQGDVSFAVIESAGVFEHDSVIGAWLALLRESANSAARATGTLPDGVGSDGGGSPASGGAAAQGGDLGS